MARKRRKSSYEKLAGKAPQDTPQYRDVYELQDFDRSELGGRRRTMRSRIILLSAAVAAIVGLCWTGMSAIQYAADAVFGVAKAPAQADPGSDPADAPAEDSAGARPPESAPRDVDFDEFLSEYFTEQAPDPSEGRFTATYVAADGRVFEEADVRSLHAEVRKGLHMTEEARLWQTADRLRAGNEHGLLPISMAPMNIRWDDFLGLYFSRQVSGIVGFWVDYDGNKYMDEASVREVYAQVQAGTMGSGETSRYVCVGGNDILDPSAANDPAGPERQEEKSLKDFMGATKGKAWTCLVIGLLSWGIGYLILWRNLKSQDPDGDLFDLNQYKNDQHIALPEELMAKFDWFPDAGAHCGVKVSSMISHVMLENKGIEKIRMPRRAQKDILDPDGSVAYLKGEILRDDEGAPIVDVVPMFDEAFGEALFDTSGAVDSQRAGPLARKPRPLRRRFDPSAIAYNPGNKDRDKLKGYDTVADLINGNWTLPEYEPQRPAGAYICDTSPVNTMSFFPAG